MRSVCVAGASCYSSASTSCFLIALRSELRGEFRAELHREIGAAKAELIKWAFAFWVPTALGVIGLYFRG